MSEAQRAETNFQAAAEARKAESRANIANAIWTGLKYGYHAGAKLLHSLFLEKGGTPEELMRYKPDDFDEPPAQPPQSQS